MKKDWLNSTKRLSTRLNKEIAGELRAYLFKRGISLQELFEYFSMLVVAQDIRAIRIVDEIEKEKIKTSIEQHGGKPFKAPILREKDLSSPEADVIYDLLDKHDPMKR